MPKPLFTFHRFIICSSFVNMNDRKTISQKQSVTLPLGGRSNPRDPSYNPTSLHAQIHESQNRVHIQIRVSL